MSELRLNRLTGEWVIIAPERAKRGGNLPTPVAAPATASSLVSPCPFCPGNEVPENECYRVEGADDRWAVRAIVNKFSVLTPSGDVEATPDSARARETVNGIGLHEVLIETPEHSLPIASFSPEQVEQVLRGYLNRFEAFYADPRVRHVIIFKNHGVDAGASQQHSHSQIVGIPIVPGQIMERIDRGRRYFSSTGLCLACAIIKQEQDDHSRIVAENAYFVAFIPYAALSPYHLWIFPKRHSACFSDQSPEMIAALAAILRSILSKVHGLLGNPAFNLVVRSLRPTEKDEPHFHWYISIVPRVNKVAGFELGTGMYINPSLPEVCAHMLRDQRDG